jgi:hypothetical protein
MHLPHAPVAARHILRKNAAIPPSSPLAIHLNATTRWKDAPEPVWTYTLGGYQVVLKKWLSYRESALLGRPLTSDEAQQFTHHVRRITAILALHGELDGHYQSSI